MLLSCRYVRIVCISAIVMLAAAGSTLAKDGSAFFPPELVARARANVGKHPWAAEIRDNMVKAAAPWAKMSDDQLWSLVFGHTITRSWMVWSNGHCPACKKGVPMYEWKVAALDRPWKLCCPQCKEIFPKNDFYRFYQTGLDEHGVFDSKRADRSLLFNVEHPDANDPLRSFGVDDGEGYVEGDKRWRFIGAYLIYGQWKQAIVEGGRKLADAYIATGDTQYAHKAGVLLDRIADLYPTFDFGKQGKMYEGPGAAGYVSTWHDACWETRDLVLTYDMILSSIREDANLQRFLAAKAKQYKLDNLKASFADIRRNIEERILIDCQKNPGKIRSNYPQTDITLAFAKTALAWPDNRDEVNAIITKIVNRTTAVDGTSGEKGLSAYSAMAIRGLADLLAMYSRMDPKFLPDMFKHVPRLHDAFRFHIDTWCLQRYYPSSGDGDSAYCLPLTALVGFPWSNQSTTVPWANQVTTAPSMYSFVWQLYEQTKDERFIQAIYLANGGKLDNLPHDLFAGDAAAFQKAVGQTIERIGSRMDLPSVNKKQWHIALLRGGKGDDERVLWLDYDSGGGHSHADGMNLGMYAKGLDFLPDFGYPPVQYGGWGAPKSQWYIYSMSHNTVVVDGKDLKGAAGTTTLWADGKQFHAVGASCPEMIGGTAYDRTAAMIDLSDRDFYVIDVFHVTGGSDHTKFTRSHFGKIATQGVPDTAVAAGDKNPIFASQHMRNWRGGAAQPGWSVDWKMENYLKIDPFPADAHMRYTDLTTDAQAYTGESWVSVSWSGFGFESTDDAWIPHVVARRHTEGQTDKAPLASTFVAVMEPYASASKIASIRCLPLELTGDVAASDANVAVEIRTTDGRRDLFVAANATRTPATSQPASLAILPMVEKTSGLTCKGQVCLVCYDTRNQISRVCLGNVRSLELPGLSVRLRGETSYVEIELSGEKPQVVTGDPSAVESITQR